MKKACKWLAAALCLAVCFAFTACGDQAPTGNSPTPVPSASQNTDSDSELQYLKAGDTYRLYHWWLQSGQEETEFRDDESIVGRYRAETLDTLKNTYGITIKFIPWTGSYWDEVRSSAFSGTPLADGMHGGSVANIMDHYWYMEIPGSCLEAISDHNISFDDDAYWDVQQQEQYCTFNGKLYGFVMNTVGMKTIEAAKVTFFNYSLVEKAGYTPQQLYAMVKDKTWNWEVFSNICAAVTDGDRGVWGTTWYDLGLQLAFSNGGDIIASESGEDVFVGYSDKHAKGWDLLKSLYDSGYTCPLDKGAYDQDAITVFKSEQTAFMINHWRRTFDNKKGSIDKYGWLPVPMGPDATDYTSENQPGECFVIFKDCNNPDGLLKAMKMLYRPIYAKGSAENQILFESEISMYCNDEESVEFLTYLQSITTQSKAVFYGINWDYMSVETTVKILSGEVTAQSYFESIAPVYNEKIRQVSRADKQ